MNVADIIIEFGAYYINSGQNMTRIVKQLYRPSETEMMFRPVVTDDTKYRASEARISRLLQPFQKSWSPTGTVQFAPVEIDQFKMKMDYQDYPDELEASWLGFLAGEEIDRKQWPFIRWVVEEHLMPQLMEDKEMNEIFAGVYATPGTPGTAGAAGTAMNGIKYLLNNWIDEGRITPITTGALETDPITFVKQIEDFVDAIDTRYWKSNMNLCMGQEWARRFIRGYREKYGKDQDFKGSTFKIPESNITIVGLASHNGSEKIWCTPYENAVRLSKKKQNENKVQVDSVDRLIKIFTDYWFGIGFVIPEIVFTNDQELNP
jgi:hypothetical protein